MFRGLLRLVLVLLILVAAAAFFLGYFGGPRSVDRPAGVGTTGRIDADRAREAGAEVGAKAADAATRAAAALADGALTAKIKSKMALDDTIKARSIDVSTTDHVVTVSGRVASAAEHDRAVQLARETSGVTRVVDHLTVAR